MISSSDATWTACPEKSNCLAFSAGIPTLSESCLLFNSRPALSSIRARQVAPRRRPAFLAPTALAELPRKDTDLPPWAGGGPLSAFVNVLINSPLYALMRVGARQLLISTAEKKGVMWRDNARTLEVTFDEDSRVAALSTVTDPDLVYPEYYLKPFHAYLDGESGNLEWLAAFEAASATKAMCARVWKGEAGLSVEDAAERLRGAHFEAVCSNAPVGWASGSNFVAVDLGCSVGISTTDAAKRLAPLRSSGDPARVIGMDASPHFLAVAQHALEEERGEGEGALLGVEYVHALGEDSKMENDSVDWWGMQFVVHELPSVATRDIFVEAFRVLKNGGVLSLIDNDPQSPVIQGLPPAIATLMKSTEPWSDQYYVLDIESLLKQVGFSSVSTTATDPRHRTVVAVK